MNDPRLRYHELGFLEVIDPPSEEELSRYYAERYYQSERGNYRKEYSQEEYKYIRTKIAQKAGIIEFIRGTNETGTLLDVGCGEGFTLAWFQERGWSVEGIDHSAAAVAHMNPDLKHRVESGDVFELLKTRIEAGAQYDLVWLNHVLEHVSDPIVLLSRIRKIVPRTGLLVVTVPNDGSTYQEKLLSDGDIPHRFWVAIPDHLAYFNYGSLMRTVTATGWNSEDVIADFPIDWFLLHPGSNYVRNPDKGPSAHRARVKLELLLGNNDPETSRAFFRALAQAGLGRNLTAFLSPR